MVFIFNIFGGLIEKKNNYGSRVSWVDRSEHGKTNNFLFHALAVIGYTCTHAQKRLSLDSDLEDVFSPLMYAAEVLHISRCRTRLDVKTKTT